MTRQHSAIPTMHKVKSSNIGSIGYNDDAKEFHVSYKSGGHYVYFDVPRHLFESIEKAESVGSTIHQLIIKNEYQYKKIENKRKGEHDHDTHTK